MRFSGPVWALFLLELRVRAWLERRRPDCEPVPVVAGEVAHEEAAAGEAVGLVYSEQAKVLVGGESFDATSVAVDRRPGPRSIGRCWDIADENIRHFKLALDLTLLGEGTANPDICREKIDQWLEYRHAHGPEDEAVL